MDDTLINIKLNRKELQAILNVLDKYVKTCSKEQSDLFLLLSSISKLKEYDQYQAEWWEYY